MTPDQFARMLAGAEVIAGRAQLPFDQLPVEERERHRLAARSLLDAVAQSAPAEQPAEPVCKFAEGCHRVEGCEPGCAVTTAQMYAQLAAAPAETALRDRILQALADALKPRYGGPQHNTPGGLPLTATAEEARLHRAQPLADAVLAELPDTARLHDQLLTQQAELAQLRGLLRTENGRANSAIDRETTTEEAGEAYRLAVSAALRLGTGATWEAIRDRAEDLTAEVEQLTETSRRLLEQRQEMAAERFAWQERGDRAEARVRQLEAAAPVDRATVEEHRLALSDALGLGTGAPWDAIRDRVTELALPPLGQDPVARRLGLVAEHRATVLNEAADALDGLTQETAAADMTMPEGRWRAGLDAGIRELRRLADEERDEWEAQTHLDQLVEDVCRPVVIGGEIVRVHGAVEMSDESRAALAEVTAIVKRRMAVEAQQQTETPCCSDPTCACVQVNAAGRCDCARWDDTPLPIRYRNWRGETADRKILPIRVWFGATDWHPEPQWFLRSVDVDRGVERDFALADMRGLPAVVPGGAGEEPAGVTLHTMLGAAGLEEKLDVAITPLTGAALNADEAIEECICTPDACPPHCPCHADETAAGPAGGAQQAKEH